MLLVCSEDASHDVPNPNYVEKFFILLRNEFTVDFRMHLGSIALVFRAAKSSRLYICQAFNVKIWCHLAVREAEKV